MNMNNGSWMCRRIQAVMGLVALVAGSAFAANPQLVWTGSGDGATWSDVANWNATPDWSVANDLDFTAVAGGTTLENDATTTFGTLTFGANKGTVTITSTKTALPAAAALVIPTGTTLDAKFKVGSAWDWTPWRVTATGAGTLWISALWEGGYGSGSLTLDGVTAVMKEGLRANAGCDVVLRNHATLMAESDFNVGTIISESADVVVDLNGKKGLLKAVQGTFSGVLKGGGTLTVQGGGSWTLSGQSPDFSGTLAVKTARVQVTGALGPNAKIESVDTGVASVGDVTVAKLSGSAAQGGISIEEGRMLTVTSGGNYGARLMGAGGVTFDGGDETLTLSGANAYAGATVVQSGTLVISDVNRLSGYPEGLVSRYSFDGELTADDLGANNLAVTAGTPTQEANGLGGSRCVRFDGASRMATVANSFIKGKTPFTVAFWVRTTSTDTWTAGGRFLQVGTWVSGDVNEVSLGATTANNYALGALMTLCGNWWFQGNWQNGNWRHYALTFDGNTVRAYANGTTEGSNNDTKTKNWDIAQAAIKLGDKVVADYDEMLVFSRALTADEVRGLYANPFPQPTAGDVLNVAPVAHWAFDDADNPGKDTSGNGIDLAVVGRNLALVENAEVNGKAAKLTSHGAYLTRTETGLPTNFPTGDSAFTVNVRVAGSGNAQDVTLFSMGDVTTANQSFRVDNGNYPRQMGYSVTGISGNATLMDGFLGNTFVDYTFVFDSTAKTMTCYRDGVMTLAPRTVSPTIAANGTINIAYNPAKNSHFEGTLDDVQVFNSALTPGQVRHLVQSTCARGASAVLPVESPVSVASDATLRIAMPGVTTAASLSGAGIVSLLTNSLFQVSSVTNFTGSILDPGELALSEGGVLKCSMDAPAINMTGTLRLPSVATVCFAESAQEIAPVCLVARATQLTGATDLSGWTCQMDGKEPAGNIPATFLIKGGDVYVKVRRGFVFMIK